MDKEINKTPRWYFGGVSCSIAACCTHPLDMMKVHLQTHTSARKLSILSSLITVAKTKGVPSLYNGLSASVSRESVYSGIRFAVFDMLCPKPGEEAHSFFMKVITAAGAGAIGGLVGAPLDLVNVRMLNDVKAGNTARKYKHVFDGLVRICREEHPRNLYNGASMVVMRAVCITVGQLSFYHQVKETVLKFDFFEDTVPTHLLCSAFAACTAATLAMPVDVMKTRMQNDATGQAKTIRQCFLDLLREGPLAFYKGYIPALTRIGFHTVITFLAFEQLRIRFGHETSSAAEH